MYSKTRYDIAAFPRYVDWPPNGVTALEPGARA